MRLTWLSDIHLDFCAPKVVEELVEKIRAEKPDAVLLTGDIATSEERHQRHAWYTAVPYLWAAVEVPLYFVLGNHDYWGEYMHETRRMAAGIGGWLTSEPNPIVLSPTTFLVGVDGWYDCEGLSDPPSVYLNDWFRIPDFDATPSGGMYSTFSQLDMSLVREISKYEADRAAKNIQDKIVESFKAGAKKVIAATHVPPFKDASYYGRKKSPEASVSLFSSSVMGERLLEIMKAWPDRELLVLCGHTHSHCVYQAADNLVVKVAESVYGAPVVEETLVIE